MARPSRWFAAAFALATSAAADPPRGLPLDSAAIASARFGNDADWYVGNIPFFESSDPLLDRVYYYRWSIVRAHQRDLGAMGYITTEFLDDVGWQREPYASLNDAAGFHLHETRWLHDRRYAGDYLNYLYLDGGNDRHFSEAVADAVWARYLVDGDGAAAVRLLPALRHVYGAWDDHFDFTKGLYWIEPLLDATEYTIASIDASGGSDGFTGGHAFRPTINAYMAANARAIGRIAALAGADAIAADYAARAEVLRQRMLDTLWSAPLDHFVDRYRVDNAHVRYWSLIRGRELAGYVPWTFGLVGDSRYAVAWRHLLAPSGFAGAAGLRTLEPGYEYYMRQYRYDKATGQRECQWNGPVWPFQTTQVLLGLADLLRGVPQDAIGRADYLRLLRQYARLHDQDGRLDLEEDYDPATGRPIVGLARSHHYFHSGFVDLIVTGLAGLVPQEGASLVVDPLLADDRMAPDRLRWFALQDVPYKGHRVSVVYDEDGSHYRRGAGLTVLVDGVPAGRRLTLGRVEMPLVPRSNPPVERPIDIAVQLVREGYPRPTASSGNDAEALHDGIDGRMWFLPELPNGWTSRAGQHGEWFAVDLGSEKRIRAAELAFFADGSVGVPAEIRLQAWQGAGWHDIAGSAIVPRGNGTVTLRFAADTSRVRVLMTKRDPRPVRLVELKLFE